MAPSAAASGLRPPAAVVASILYAWFETVQPPFHCVSLGHARTHERFQAEGCGPIVSLTEETRMGQDGRGKGPAGTHSIQAMRSAGAVPARRAAAAAFCVAV